MVNSQLVQEIVNATKLDLRVQAIPNATPTYEVNPKVVKNGLSINGSAINSASTTLITTPSDQDFYIYGYQVGYIKDATATSALTAINYTDENGTAKVLVGLPTLTLTAGIQSTSLTLPNKIKCKKGSAITLTNSTATGNISANATIFYLIDEVN